MAGSQTTHGIERENWDVMAPLLVETAKAHKLKETGTELELKTLLLQKNMEGRHLERAELNRFCSAIWRKRES